MHSTLRKKKGEEMKFIAPKDTIITINKHGHQTLSIAGSHLTGKEEIDELESSKFPVGDHARQMLMSKRRGCYDDVHRLVLGESYGVVLLPGTCIPRDKKRTSNNLHRKAVDTFGYSDPLAGAAPPMCEPAFCQYMVSIGVRDIVILHNPIPAADPNRYMLKIQCFEQILSSCPGHPDFLWDCEVLFAFFCNPEG